MLELTHEDLSFEREEIQMFFKEVMSVGVSENIIKVLENRTEGLQMAALSLKNKNDEENIVKYFNGNHKFVLEYLMEEVFNLLDKETQEFLMKTSILDESERVKDVFKWGIIINFSIIAFVSLLIECFPKEILMGFARDFGVLNIGEEYLRINAIGYLIFGISYITNGIINGSGKTIITMVISSVSLLVLRIPLSDIMSKTSMGLKGIWFAILITYAFTSICSMTYYLSGKYKENLYVGKEVCS